MTKMSLLEQIPVIMLFVMISVYFAISYLIVNVFLKGSREVTFELKPDSLDKQYLFWLGIIVPIGVFFYLEYFVFLSNEITFNADGFKIFFEESKLPLGVLALSPIFGVIVSNIHRTIQTEKQINVTEVKNISDSFYTHNKYIIEEFRSIQCQNSYLKMAVDSPNGLYKKIYPFSNIKHGYNETISQSFILIIIKKYYELKLEIENFTNDLKNVKAETNSLIIESIIEYTEIVYLNLIGLMKECHINVDDECKSYFDDNKSKFIKELDFEIQVSESHLQDEIIAYTNISALHGMIKCIILYLTLFLATLKRIFDVINLEDTIELQELKKIIENDLRYSYFKIAKLKNELYQPIGEFRDTTQYLSELNKNS